jgi:hypothetical protein
VNYVLSVLSGLSHLLNAVLGGDPRYSFSARVGKAEVDGKPWARIVASIIDALLFNHDHCEEQARLEGLI